MSVMSRLIVWTLPFVPKFVVGRVASSYVAGETLADAVSTIRRANPRPRWLAATASLPR